jgi:Lipase (class 3)
MTPPLTVRTGAIKRVWLPTPSPAPPPGTVAADAALLTLVSNLCAESYKDGAAEYFAAGGDLKHATDCRRFGRCSGRLFWRPLAFVLMPINYLIILYWLVALIGPLLAIGALTETWLEEKIGWSGHLWGWLLTTTPEWLYYLTLGVAASGVAVGALVAVAPWCASGRAYGLFDTTTNRAVVIFCGSKWYDNFTINGLVWLYYIPFYLPMRHMGFQRAWDHIQPAIRQWLNDLVREKKVTQIVLSGHSLGGALAQIAAYDLASEFPVSHVISLGSACIGGKGMLKQYASREVKGGARLHDRTWHFTSPRDIMPRIPPVSIFRQVGRRFRMLEQGGVSEGIEGNLWQSFLSFFAWMLSMMANGFMNMITKLRSGIRKLLKIPPPKNYGANQFVKYDPLLSALSAQGLKRVEPVDQTSWVPVDEKESPVTLHELVDYFSSFIQLAPWAIPALLFMGAVASIAAPFTMMLTMYLYYVVAFATGFFIWHAAGKYRDAFSGQR